MWLGRGAGSQGCPSCSLHTGEFWSWTQALLRLKGDKKNTEYYQEGCKWSEKTMHTTKKIAASQFYRVPVHTTTESLPSALISILEHPQLRVKQYRTQVVPNRPGLIIVKMDISLAVCLGEERVCQDPSRPIERQVIPMPVPGEKTHCTSDQQPSTSGEQHHLAKGGRHCQGTAALPLTPRSSHQP